MGIVRVEESRHNEFEVYDGNEVIGYIEVKSINYHKGSIPVFKGELYLDSEYVWKLIKETRKPTWKKVFEKKADEEMYDFFFYLYPDEGVRSFVVYYNEFLHPKSEGLGLNIGIDYPKNYSLDEIKMNLELAYRDKLDEVVEGTLRSLAREFKEFAKEYFNSLRILEEGLKEIYEIYKSELETYEEDYDEDYEDEDYKDEGYRDGDEDTE